MNLQKIMRDIFYSDNHFAQKYLNKRGFPDQYVHTKNRLNSLPPTG